MTKVAKNGSTCKLLRNSIETGVRLCRRVAQTISRAGAARLCKKGDSGTEVSLVEPQCKWRVNSIGHRAGGGQAIAGDRRTFRW